MEKICGNCRWWGFVGDNPNKRNCFEITNYQGATTAVTRFDFSCPRFTEKEPEIPQELMEWTPVWHPESEKPTLKTEVLLRESGIGYTVVKWDGKHWETSWNSDHYSTSTSRPCFWTELPR